MKPPNSLFHFRFYIASVVIIFSLFECKAQLSNSDNFQDICEQLKKDTTNVNRIYSIGDLWLLRNSIFARKGYNFSNPDLKYFFEALYPHVYSNRIENSQIILSQEEGNLVKWLKKIEEKKKAERRTISLNESVFTVENNMLQKDEIIIKNVEGAEYISVSHLNKNICAINLESKFFIDAVDCCGIDGATNQTIKQFLYYKDRNHLVEIPTKYSEGNLIKSVLDNKYILFEEEILSGAPSLSIYDIESFKLLGHVDELYEIKSINSEIEVWEYTNSPVEYPFKWVRKLIFRNGQLSPTNVEEKVEAFGYFAG